MPEGTSGAYLISPDGKTRKMFTSRTIPSKIDEGWSVAPGQTIGTSADGATEQRITGESLQANVEYGDVRQMTPQSQISDEGVQIAREKEYGGRAGEAILAGAARGLTFGLSDVVGPASGIVDKDTLQGLQEFQPLASTAGELGSMLIGGVGALGEGAVAKGLAATPLGASSRLAAEFGKGSTARFLAAGAGEGALQGTSQAVSRIALSNEEIAAETAVSDILKDAALGGIIGVGGAAFFKGGEKLWNAGKAKLIKPPAHLDIATAEGAEFLGGTANRLRETMDSADDMFVKTDPLASKRMTPEELVAIDTRNSTVGTSIDSAISRGATRRSEMASQAFEMPAPPRALGDIEVPLRVDPELPRGPELPVGPATDAGEVAGRILELEDELAAAVGVETPALATKFSGAVDDPASFDAMMAARNRYDDAQSMVSGSRERKIRDLAGANREAYGKAVGGVDEAAVGARAATGGSRPITEIEAEIAALSASSSGLPKELAQYEKAMTAYEKQAAVHATKVEKVLAKADADYARSLARYEKQKLKLAGSQLKEVVAYEKQVAAIEGMIAHRNRAVAEIDDAMAAVASRGKHLRKSGLAKGEMFQGARLSQAQMGTEVADDLGRLRSLLGDSPDDIKAFAAEAKQFRGQADAVSARLRAPFREGALEARTAYEAASKELRSAVGDPTAQNIGKLFNAEPEELVNGFASLAKYSDAMTELAVVSGDKALMKSTAESLQSVQKHMLDSLPPEAIQSVKGMDSTVLAQMVGIGGIALPDFDAGPFSEIAKVALVFAALRKGGGISTTAKAGAKLSSTFTGRVASAGAAGTARAAMPQGGLIARGGRSAASMAAYQTFGGFLDRLGGARGLHQLSGRSTSQVVQAVNRLAKKGGRQLMTGQSAAGVLKAAKWAEDSDTKAAAADASLQELFKLRSEQIRKMSHDRERLQMDLWTATAEMRDLHPTFGDKVEAGPGGLGVRINYAMDKMPKDPGGHHMFGKSVWQPDDFQIQEYTNILKALADPMSVVDGVIDGSITAEGAKAFRETAPKTFEAVQQEIASRADELSESLSYDEQNRLSVLMGVPVNETTTPEYIQFIASTYAQRQQAQAEKMGEVDANALIQGVPTQAQQLLKRGNTK